MLQLVSLPLWLVIVLVVLAAVALLDRLLVPSVRWFIRRRVSRVLEEVGQQLHIKIEPFKLTKREVLIDRLQYDPEIMQEAEMEAQERGIPRALVMERVARYAQEIVPAFNAYFYFRIGCWLSQRVAQLLYRVRLGYTDEHGLAAIAPRSTVVFVMNHRSNMDYVLVGYLAAAHTALSYAVGEWARVWPLQSLIRSLGAYFVRRRSRNPLYRLVLARYISMATAGGVTQAMYPEGGLSRDGRLGRPKLGLLDYMLRSFDPDGERDLVFVPIGLNYDRVLEDRSLLLDLDEAAPPPTLLRSLRVTLGFVLRNLTQMVLGRWHRFGYVCVNFGTPLSMRQLCSERDLQPARLDREARFAVVAELADTLMDAVGTVIPVVPVSLVASVFLRSPEPLTGLELKVRVHQLVEELESGNAHIHIPRQDREYAIEVGLRMLRLRHVIEEQEGMLVAVPAERRLLEYYANSITHLLDRASEERAAGDGTGWRVTGSGDG